MHTSLGQRCIGAGAIGWMAVLAAAQTPLNIGSQRELFVDHHLIARLEGASLRLHEPQPAGTALRFDRPYEGVYSGYATVIKDDATYRMYYRGLASSIGGEAEHSIRTEVTCCAESTDGITWTKPDLELFEVKGIRINNVIMARHPACHNFCPFLDQRPGVDPSQRFKAVGGNSEVGLIAFVSADGLRWRQMQPKPIITGGAFDSQNVVFYSAHEECYICYFRTSKTVGTAGYRWISRTTSTDFVTWTPPVEMDMGDAPPEHYYTNQTGPYCRAPQLYISLFARFMPGRQAISTQQARELGVVGDYGGDCSDACFMTSRGGTRFDRTFMEGFIRPGRDPGNWTSRTNYPALGIVPTGDGNLSVYIQRHYAQPSHYLQRLVLRPDGFASLNGPYAGGGMVSKPLTFTSSRLFLNGASSAAGRAMVELQDAKGAALSGYALADCDPITGDDLDRAVTWHGKADVAALAGKPVVLRIVLHDADVYALQFR